MTTKLKRTKPFEKGHLSTNMVHMSDLPPESRRNAGIKSARAAQARKQPPVVVTLNWKNPHG